MTGRAAQSSAVATADSAIETTLTQRLRRAAIAREWPKEIARSLTVTCRDGAFHVVTSPDALERALDWEFGTPTIEAKPVIRRFMNHLESAAGADYSDLVFAALVKSGEV